MASRRFETCPSLPPWKKTTKYRTTKQFSGLMVITTLRSCDMVWYANVRLGGQHWLTLHNQLKETRLQIKLELWFKNIKTNALWNFFENKTTSISNLNTWNRILMYWKLWIHNLNGLNLTLFANIKFPPIPNCNFFNLI